MADPYVLSKRDMGRLQRVMRWVERHMSPPPQWRRRMNFGGGGGTGTIRRAKLRLAMTDATQVLVKLLDASGVEEGDDLTANFFCATTLADNTVIPVFQDLNSSWYCTGPVRPTEETLIIDELRVDYTELEFQRRERTVSVMSRGTQEPWNDWAVGTDCTVP